MTGVQRVFWGDLVRRLLILSMYIQNNIIYDWKLLEYARAILSELNLSLSNLSWQRTVSCKPDPIGID